MYSATCITGHRQLFGTYNGPIWDALEKVLRGEILKRVVEGDRTFMCGGAIGVDQLFGREVIRIRNEKAENSIMPGADDLHLVIARPFPGQDAKWPETSKKFYRWLCEKADRVFDVSVGSFTKAKMITRDKKMVDLCGTVIAVWDGRREGGTWETMQYANKKGKKILVISVRKVENNINITQKWYNNEKEVNHEHQTVNSK